MRTPENTQNNKILQGTAQENKRKHKNMIKHDETQEDKIKHENTQ